MTDGNDNRLDNQYVTGYTVPAVRYAVQDTACRVLLVGEDNPYGSEPEFALYCYPSGCSGQRLCDNIFGLSHSNYLALWRVNLCDGTWSAKEARERAERILDSYLAPWRVVVMLGRKVADAFGKVTGQKIPAFQTAKYQFNCSEYTNKVYTLIALPHPSGRNTIWNSPGPRATALQLVAQVAPEIPWGETLK